MASLRTFINAALFSILLTSKRARKMPTVHPRIMSPEGVFLNVLRNRLKYHSSSKRRGVSLYDIIIWLCGTITITLECIWPTFRYHRTLRIEFSSSVSCYFDDIFCSHRSSAIHSPSPRHISQLQQFQNCRNVLECVVQQLDIAYALALMIYA